MNTERLRFLQGEFERAISQYPTSSAQQQAEPVYDALQTGDLERVTSAITSFINSTEATSSYDHELAYSLALDGRGDPAFSAEHVPESVLKPERRENFRDAVRTGQMDAAAAIIGIDQNDKFRAIVRNLLAAIGE
jgi:hypothetical protein